MVNTTARKMKDSGINWIGEIPENWSVGKIKYLSNVYTGNSISDGEKDNYSICESALPYISTKDIDVETKRINYNNGMYIPLKNNSFKIAPKNSTLLCIEGGSAGKKIAITNEDVCFVNKLCCFKCNDKLNEKLLYYYCQCDAFLTDFYLNMSGLIGGVSINKIKQIQYILPPIEEQNQIKDYLDEKCLKIEETIEKEKIVIEKLKEYKQSVITEAITKGLNFNAQMKDSNVDWIEKVPAHWSVKKLKYEFRIKKDIAGKEGYDVLSVTQSGIKVKDLSSNEGQMAMDYSKYQLVDIDDYVMNHMDLLTGYMDCSKYSGVTSPDYRVFYLINKENNKHYFKHVFQTCYKNKIFYGLGQGVSGLGRWRLQSDKFLNFVIPVPPVEEQSQIVEHINKKSNEIDKLVQEKEQLIEKLTEYKKSLIYECVTGKKEIA